MSSAVTGNPLKLARWYPNQYAEFQQRQKSLTTLIIPIGKPCILSQSNLLEIPVVEVHCICSVMLPTRCMLQGCSISRNTLSMSCLSLPGMVKHKTQADIICMDSRGKYTPMRQASRDDPCATVFFCSMIKPKSDNLLGFVQHASISILQNKFYIGSGYGLGDFNSLVFLVFFLCQPMNLPFSWLYHLQGKGGRRIARDVFFFC